jgi:peptidyl-prolyl cis-trans isomerase A (cyclophilin A)
VLALVTLTAACATAAGGRAAGDPRLLLDPTNPAFSVAAPDSFDVRFETTAGDIVVRAIRAWAPHGVDRFYNLARNGYYDGARFFRVVDGFVAQFGISGDSAVNAAWSRERMPDDSVQRSNVRGSLSFASAGPDSRTTQMYINLGDNSRLDARGFAVFGWVIAGMPAVDSLYAGYGEGGSAGGGPSQGRIQREGNADLEREFPDLDWIRRAVVTRR